MGIDAKLLVCHKNKLSYDELSEILKTINDKVTEFYNEKRALQPNWVKSNNPIQFRKLESDEDIKWSSPQISAHISIQVWFYIRFCVSNESRALAVFPDSKCDNPEYGEHTEISLGSGGISDELLRKIAEGFPNKDCYYCESDFNDEFVKI